jgi:SPP1 gp7 family putative phage head morphogenesis protein
VKFDSVLSPLLTARFADDKPLIQIERITRDLDRVEAISTAIETSTEDAADRLLVQANRATSIEQINQLTWGLNSVVQRQIVRIWREAWRIGNQHALEEMQAAVPASVRQQVESTTFALDIQTLSLIAALLAAEPGLIIPIGVEQAILQRALVIAGNYSKAILDKLKGSLIAATVPLNGQPVISRRELQQQIEKTLNVGKVRAEMIARTETTYAYNNARLATMQESGLVDYVRFLAIDDNRTTDICRSRNGMLIPIGETLLLAANRPPLHVRCRSMLSPVMTQVNPTHAKWAADPTRSAADRELAPLPRGWRTT